MIDRIYDEQGRLLREEPFYGRRIDRIGLTMFHDGIEYEVIKCELHPLKGYAVTVVRPLESLRK